MKITNRLIASLDPCKDRLNNYLTHYKGKSHTPHSFMRLKKITTSDKLWVAFRLMPKENIKLAAADIAESVLHIFEAKYPNDIRPRLAIEAARGNDKDAYAAAYAANAAANAANAAAYAAAAYAANAANAAAYAAAYAAYAAYAANAANAYAANAASSREMQEKLNLKIALRYLK